MRVHGSATPGSRRPTELRSGTLAEVAGLTDGLIDERLEFNRRELSRLQLSSRLHPFARLQLIARLPGYIELPGSPVIARLRLIPGFPVPA